MTSTATPEQHRHERVATTRGSAASQGRRPLFFRRPLRPSTLINSTATAWPRRRTTWSCNRPGPGEQRRARAAGKAAPQDLTQYRTRVSLLRKRAQAAQPVPAGLMRRGFGRTEPSAGEKAQTTRNEPSICARASARRMSHRKAASRPHSATPRRTPRARQVHATCAAQK